MLDNLIIGLARMTSGAVKYRRELHGASKIVCVVYEHRVTPVYGYNLLSTGSLNGCG